MTGCNNHDRRNFEQSRLAQPMFWRNMRRQEAGRGLGWIKSPQHCHAIKTLSKDAENFFFSRNPLDGHLVPSPLPHHAR